ncbi:MAG TPA: TonB C-terminal domain-containing protein [Gemmatimonadales bacterium]|nr:TonB C-terminal domain-containing protein [Gemmatimonadales bacterium]
MRHVPRLGTNVPLGLIGTITVHGAAMAMFLVSATGARSEPPTYRVRLIAAPDVVAESRPAPPAVQREAAPPEPTPPTQKPPPKNTVSPAPPPPVSDTKKREAAPRTTPQPRVPGEAPSTGSDPATVSTEGVEFPYPEYLQNIVSQVLRRWQRPLESTPLEAELSFMVHRNGTVTDLQFVKRSGSFAFDLEAQGAVEEAGQYKAFGALPDGWIPDVLFVRFYFSGKRQ